MSINKSIWFGLLALFPSVVMAAAPASAQQQQKPNILVIMADDIGYWNISAYKGGATAFVCA
jgi:arylsulfatase